MGHPERQMPDVPSPDSLVHTLTPLSVCYPMFAVTICSTLSAVYHEFIPYSLQLQGLLGFLLVGYFFYLCCAWQRMVLAAEDSY